MNNIMLKAINKSEEFIKQNFLKIPYEELQNKYEEIYDYSEEAHGLPNPLIDAIDEFPSQELRRKLKEFFKLSEEKFNEVFSEVTSPLYISFLRECELRIIKLAIKIKEEKLSEKETKEAIRKIFEDYWWISLGWENLKAKEISYFEEELQLELKKNLEELKEQVKKFSIEPIKKKRAELIKKYDIPKELVILIETFDDYTMAHDLRKEMQVKVLYAQYKLLNEISRRLKISIDDIEWLTFDEVLSLIKTKIYDKEEIERRKEACLAILSAEGIEVISGEEAKNKGYSIVEENLEETNELEGQGVSKGKVEARARVVTGAEQAIKELEEGEVLICGMTLPDYVPAMKKASAIITDEGGMTCHAAIVSRELGKPCIVGTRSATSIIKTGYLLEVDANKGKIKILEK